jgi:hypothetical protein
VLYSSDGGGHPFTFGARYAIYLSSPLFHYLLTILFRSHAVLIQLRLQPARKSYNTGELFDRILGSSSSSRTLFLISYLIHRFNSDLTSFKHNINAPASHSTRRNYARWFFILICSLLTFLFRSLCRSGTQKSFNVSRLLKELEVSFLLHFYYLVQSLTDPVTLYMQPATHKSFNASGLLFGLGGTVSFFIHFYITYTWESFNTFLFAQRYAFLLILYVHRLHTTTIQVLQLVSFWCLFRGLLAVFIQVQCPTTRKSCNTRLLCPLIGGRLSYAFLPLGPDSIPC